MSQHRKLLSEVKNALNHAVSPNLTSASDGADLYEAYVWALVLRAAKNEGARISFRNVHGNILTGARGEVFHFRTSPSAISSVINPYSHAILAFPSCNTLEAHVGIYVAGKSQVRHECDVAVVDASEADFCRQNSVDPKASRVILAAECKYYVASNVGINLGRSFLGLTDDIYYQNRFFVAASKSASVTKLLEGHNKQNELALTPRDLALETRLVCAFEKVFVKYKATFL